MSPKGKRLMALKRLRSHASRLGYRKQFRGLTVEINWVAKTWP